MREWLTTTQLGKLHGITGDAIKRRIYAGKYQLIKKDSKPGKGGRRGWLISIHDPAVPQDVRDLFERQAAKFFGLPDIEDVKRLAHLLEEEIILLRENNALLKWISKRLK
ncbi:MAG: hypothetical protein PHC90_12550 [Syntrophorhabdaceae bacterium]|nr:hypothetical protein [Syntrophorhabdaceae bacterium]